MRDLSSADESLMKRIGRAICEFTGSNPDATMMIHKISAEIRVNEREIIRVVRLAKERGLLETPTSNQVKLGTFGASYFCNE